MKKKILISVLLCVAVLSAGLTGCMKADEEAAPTETPFSILQTKVATLEGWQGGVNTQLADKPTRAEMDAAIAAGVTIPDLASLTARIGTLETDAATLKTDVATLEAENAALEARLDGLVEEGVVTPTLTGKVTVEFADEELLMIHSSDSGVTMPHFVVSITNGTNEKKYVSYDISLRCVDPYGRVVKADVISEPALETWGGTHLEIKFEVSPDLSGATAQAPVECGHILFYYAGKFRVPVDAGDTVELHHELKNLKTDDSTRWEGNLTGIVAATTW